MSNYTVRVCTDCYFALHYGITAMIEDEEGRLWGPFDADERADMANTEFVWFAGDSDTPCDREPLNLLRDLDIADGGPDDDEEFSWSSCDGCGSTLGGNRYELTVFEVMEDIDS